MRQTRLLLPGLVLIVLGVLIGSVVLSAAGPSPSLKRGDMLEVASRDRLRICVDVVDVPRSRRDYAVRRVSEALPRVAAHPRWEKEGYGKGGGPVVAAGCPGEPYLLRPGVEVVNGQVTGDFIIPEVDQPSPFQLFVFVISEELRAKIIKGSRDVRSAAQEAFCGGGLNCATVTTGVYLTAAELENTDFVVEWLEKGLGLEFPVPQTPDYFQLTPGADERRKAQ